MKSAACHYWERLKEKKRERGGGLNSYSHQDDEFQKQIGQENMASLIVGFITE